MLVRDHACSRTNTRGCSLPVVNAQAKTLRELCWHLSRLFVILNGGRYSRSIMAAPNVGCLAKLQYEHILAFHLILKH